MIRARTSSRSKNRKLKSRNRLTPTVKIFSSISPKNSNNNRSKNLSSLSQQSPKLTNPKLSNLKWSTLSSQDLQSLSTQGHLNIVLGRLNIVQSPSIQGRLIIAHGRIIALGYLIIAQGRPSIVPSCHGLQSAPMIYAVLY